MNNIFGFEGECIKNRIVRVRMRLAPSVAKIPDLNVTYRRENCAGRRGEGNILLAAWIEARFIAAYTRIIDVPGLPAFFLNR